MKFYVTSGRKVIDEDNDIFEIIDRLKDFDKDFILWNQDQILGSNKRGWITFSTPDPNIDLFCTSFTPREMDAFRVFFECIPIKTNIKDIVKDFISGNIMSGLNSDEFNIFASKLINIFKLNNVPDQTSSDQS